MTRAVLGGDDSWLLHHISVPVFRCSSFRDFELQHDGYCLTKDSMFDEEEFDSAFTALVSLSYRMYLIVLKRKTGTQIH